MKKFIVILIVSFLAFSDCKKIEPEPKPVDLQPRDMRKFLNSAEWTKYECLFTKYSNYGIGIIEKDVNDSTAQMFLPFYNVDSVKTAMLQIVKMEPGLLPNNDIYFINLIDLTRFDNECRTGNVSMYGTNFDNFLHDEYLVVDNVIQTGQDYPVPQKYMEEQAKKMGFFKCYSLVRDYYDSRPFIRFLCDWDGAACILSASLTCLEYLTQ